MLRIEINLWTLCECAPSTAFIFYLILVSLSIFFVRFILPLLPIVSAVFFHTLWYMARCLVVCVICSIAFYYGCCCRRCCMLALISYTSSTSIILWHSIFSVMLLLLLHCFALIRFVSFSMLFILVVCILFELRTWIKCVKITSKVPIERYTYNQQVCLPVPSSSPCTGSSIYLLTLCISVSAAFSVVVFYCTCFYLFKMLFYFIWFVFFRLRCLLNQIFRFQLQHLVYDIGNANKIK